MAQIAEVARLAWVQNRAQLRWWKEYAAVTILFLLPAFFFLAVFLLWPIFRSFQLSFSKWNGIDPTPAYVGFENWRELIRDEVFWRALPNNLLIVFYSLLIQLPLGMALAFLLDKGGRKMVGFKVIYFLPMLMSSVAIGILFKYIYDPYFGLLNTILKSIGLSPLARAWLGKPDGVLEAVTAVICWQYTPFYMLLFFAAVSGLPVELKEAALMDGASELQYIWKVALPQLIGTIRTAATISIIGSLTYFDLIWVMTEGGPNHASELMATYMVKRAFQSFQMGYGSTIAVMLFVIVLLVALTVFFSSQRIGDVE